MTTSLLVEVLPLWSLLTIPRARVGFGGGFLWGLFVVWVTFVGFGLWCVVFGGGFS
ncbi:hypothetical protein HMPREF1978_00098 [Actinomyces graevenitzii F0530]|uniref:Uncharacterized protein n=1 Tax=Actinomyces graevenitzii F0530 TaxID=1321817 RepID=U1QF67_9ACTO|nr:hypothetical protein HMPREF1978_00098 [Actinomyces graevenitzii F0530]